nr:Chain C, Spike protein S2 [Severe acute respiratory syndrome coronavirus 2]
RLQSLQIYV